MDTLQPKPGSQPQAASNCCVSSFLTKQTKQQCSIASQDLFPLATITLLPSQGYCSYTFLVSNYFTGGSEAESQFILQFRHSKFALDINTTSAAALVYGTYAPNTQELLDFTGTGGLPNLRLYRMDLIGGVTYQSIAPAHIILSEAEFERQLKLIEGFANFAARGWQVDSIRKIGTHTTGKVGAVLPQKLKQLADGLPRENLKAAARKTLAALEHIKSLPQALNHGDVLPSNIMVDPVTLQLVGLVDWAEAESLPFGTCLYGLEHLLGIMTVDTHGRQTFEYYNRAFELRVHFWHSLRDFIPALTMPSLRECVLQAKKMGTLLWHGTTVPSIESSMIETMRQTLFTWRLSFQPAMMICEAF